MSGSTDDTGDERIRAATAAGDQAAGDNAPRDEAAGDNAPRDEAAGDEAALDAEASLPSRRARMVGRAVGVVRPLLIDKVERDHRQSDAQFLRRRIGPPHPRRARLAHHRAALGKVLGRGVAGTLRRQTGEQAIFQG